MKGMVLKVDGSVEPLTYTRENGLDVWQKAVGGYVREVPQNYSSKITMLCNEDGLAKGLQLNKLATLLSGLFPQDIIVGDVVVVGAADDDGYETTLPDDLIEAVSMIDVDKTWRHRVIV